MKLDFSFIKKMPPYRLLLLIWLLTLFACIGALLTLIWENSDSYAPLVYMLYAVAAILLAYSTYTAIRFAGELKRHTLTKLKEHPLTHRLMQDFGFRTRTFAFGSLMIGVAYSALHAVLACIESSVWYTALAGYYLLLTAMRGYILLKRPQDTAGEWRSYRICGILLVLLDIALSFAIAEMIFNSRAFIYAGLLIYASAAYAFYKLTLALLNFVRARRESDVRAEAIRNINLTDAAVSLLALQTALLANFSQDAASSSRFNTLTGIAVSLLTVGLGIFMILRSIKKQKTQENINNGK